MAAGPRKRNYQAEERARNLSAQKRGFATRASQRAAERRGEVATARQRKADPKLAAREARRDTARAGGFKNPNQLKAARKVAREWAAQHSRQSVSQPPKDDAKFGEFYRAIVEPWDGKRNAYHKAALKDYLVTSGHITEDEWEVSYEPTVRHWN